MVNKLLGCLAEEDGNYSKARIGALLLGLVFLGFFIWLIVLTVNINNIESTSKAPETNATTEKDMTTKPSETTSKPETIDCIPNPCQNNGICNNTKNGYICNCPPGYNGTNCEIDVDECIAGTDDCDPNAKCENSEGSFKCTCNAGYTGDGKNCEDVDECVDESDDCALNAKCENSEGSFTCTCNSGYTGDGKNCTDVDECLAETDDCDQNAKCKNSEGSFKCTCNAGYTGDGKNCEDVDECVTQADDCAPNAKCENSEGSFTCTCNPGYTGDGKNCAAKWEMISKTELTCKGTPIEKKEKVGLSEDDCKEFAESNERAKFIFYASKTAKWQDPELCILYKSCDPKKEGRVPKRPGKTFEKKSTGTWKVIAETKPTCAGEPVFPKDEDNKITFDDCIELLYTKKEANFVFFDDVTTKNKGHCVGYKKCDLEEKAKMPKTSGVIIKKKESTFNKEPSGNWKRYIENDAPESIIRAYWDTDSCGPNGPNYNWNWCNRVTRVCPSEISTELCQHGSAYRTKSLLDATINNCTYVFYAEYTCQGIDANEIVGKWRPKDTEIVITCEKSDVGNNAFKCNSLNHSVEVEWQNEVYYILHANNQWTSGAITNDVFTWSTLNSREWVFWERVE